MYKTMSLNQSAPTDCMATKPCWKAPRQVELSTSEEWDLLFSASGSSPRSEFFTRASSRGRTFEPSLPSTLSDDDDDRAHVFTPVSELSSVTSVSDLIEEPKLLPAAHHHHYNHRCFSRRETFEPSLPSTLSDDEDKAYLLTPVSELSSVTSLSDLIEGSKLFPARHQHQHHMCFSAFGGEEPHNPADDLEAIGSHFGVPEEGDFLAEFDKDVQELLPESSQPSLLLKVMLDRDLTGP